MPYQFISAPLDAQDDPRAVNIKRAYLYARATGKIEKDDCRDPCVSLIGNYDGSVRYKIFPLPSWLTPKPELVDLPLINPQNYTDFFEQNGCYYYAKKLKSFIEKSIFPALPVTIGVDHSLTGGVVMALSKMVGEQNLTLIVLDSHLDALPASIRKNKENAKEAEGDRETYNCGNFLRYLIKDGIIIPGNLIIIGPSDCPLKLENNFDQEQKNFFYNYHSTKETGIRILHRDDCRNVILPNKILDSIQTPYLYLSIDMDIGANNSLLAVRLPDRVGLSGEEILDIIEGIKKRVSLGKFDLLGFDLMEINVHLLGITSAEGRRDQTIKLGRKIIEVLI